MIENKENVRERLMRHTHYDVTCGEYWNADEFAVDEDGCFWNYKEGE